MKKYCLGIFTLIELVTVISIIIILVSLLLPALRSVKEKSMEIVCKSNLKQSISLLLMYSNDYNGYLPAAYDGASFWPETLCNMEYLQWPLFEKSSILICPTFTPKIYKQTNKDFYDTYGLWTGANGYGTAVAGSYYFLKVEYIESNRIVLADSTRANDYPNGAQTYYLSSGNGSEKITSIVRTVHVRHAGHKMAHVSFCDGSTRAVNSNWLKQDARYYWRK